MMQSTLTTLSLLALTGGLFQVTSAQIADVAAIDDDPNFKVCGMNYTEVVNKCSTKPRCPTGDRCPVGYTCFQLNENLCPPETSAPTSEPTAAPTAAPTTLPPAPAPAFKICAAAFSQAASLCFDSTAKDCETCNNVTEACFTVAPEQCTDGNIDAPTAPQAVTPITEPKPTPSPTTSVSPTKAPTPNRFFCATNWDTVDENCSTATPCPNGQQDCASTGMNCYQIQADKCTGPTSPVDTDTGSSVTEGSDAQLDAPPASSPVRVCAKDLIEATFNCNTNTPCPDGSAASCSSGEACIPVDSCDKSSGSEATGAPAVPTQASQSPVPSPTTGENQTSTDSSQSPTPGMVGFMWNTPAPNGSNIPHISSVIQSFLVGSIFLGAALV